MLLILKIKGDYHYWSHEHEKDSKRTVQITPCHSIDSLDVIDKLLKFKWRNILLDFMFNSQNID
jgi:hypothetical protein